jgi:ribosomal-protein-alanine N-acetyltransferase
VISVEPLKPEHCELAASWLSDGEINGWLTSEWRDQIVSSRAVAVMLRSKRNRLLLVRDDDQACGLVGYSDFDETDRVAMIWYLLGFRPLGRRGIITAAVSEALGIAFREYGLCCVYAWIIAGNQSSRRVLEKNGFAEVGRLRSATRQDGEQVDRVYFDITREDWSLASVRRRASSPASAPQA